MKLLKLVTFNFSNFNFLINVTERNEIVIKAKLLQHCADESRPKIRRNFSFLAEIDFITFRCRFRQQQRHDGGLEIHQNFQSKQ